MVDVVASRDDRGMIDHGYAEVMPEREERQGRGRGRASGSWLAGRIGHDSGAAPRQYGAARVRGLDGSSSGAYGGRGGWVPGPGRGRARNMQARGRGPGRGRGVDDQPPQHDYSKAIDAYIFPDTRPRLANASAALAFVQTLARMADATELVWKLVNTKAAGKLRVQEVCRFAASSSAGVTSLLVPMLRALMGPERTSHELQAKPLATLLEVVRVYGCLMLVVQGTGCFACDAAAVSAQLLPCMLVPASTTRAIVLSSFAGVLMRAAHGHRGKAREVRA